MKGASRYWGLIPAAGVGRRMGGAVPKQYLPLNGKSVLDHSLGRLLNYPLIQGVCVALSAADEWWPSCLHAGHPRVFTADGGIERCHSVLNALRRLGQVADPDDWVLVHDAVRPCLRSADIDRMVEALQDHPAGGILAVPLLDTVKRVDGAGDVVETLPREQLWRAFTPQMFRLGPLGSALEAVLGSGMLVTDEASAMERGGHAPRLVEGHADNIKITRPEDLALANFYLSQQQA